MVPTVLSDAHGRYVEDSAGAWIGRPGVWVSRMLPAGTVANTRRLG